MANEWDVDLRPLLSPVEHQKFMPTCTANSVIGCVEFHQRAERDRHEYSRLFLNWCGKSLEGTEKNASAGLSVPACFRALELFGVCRESRWPYQAHKSTTKPSSRAFWAASRLLGMQYGRVAMTLDGMRECLAVRRLPFVLAFVRFKFQVVTEDGEFMINEQPVVGSHAVMAVGYSDAAQKVLIRNSWGSAWGMEGYGKLSYRYLTSPGLTDDWMVLESVGKVVSLS
jgi:C1A family cysteine protease